MFLKFFILCFIVINLLVVGMRLRASTHHRSDESLVDDDIRSSFLMFSRLIKFYPSEDRVDTLRTFHRSALNRRQESAVVPVTVTATVTVVSVLNFDQQPSSSTTQILTAVPVVSNPVNTQTIISDTLTLPVTSSPSPSPSSLPPIPIFTSSPSIVGLTTSSNSIASTTRPFIPLFTSSALPPSRSSSPNNSPSIQQSDQSDLDDATKLAIPAITISILVAVIILIIGIITLFKLKNLNDPKNSYSDSPERSSSSIFSPFIKSSNNLVSLTNDDYYRNHTNNNHSLNGVGDSDYDKRFKSLDNEKLNVVGDKVGSTGNSNSTNYESIGKIFNPIKFPKRSIAKGTSDESRTIKNDLNKDQKILKDPKDDLNQPVYDDSRLIYIQQNLKNRVIDGSGEEDSGPTDYQKKMARKHKRLTNLLSNMSSINNQNQLKPRQDEPSRLVNQLKKNQRVENFDLDDNDKVKSSSSNKKNYSEQLDDHAESSALNGKLWLPQSSLGQGLRRPV